jgi:hypothetical protein
VLRRWLGWFEALAAVLVTALLITLDVDDSGLRHWWVDHALTTATVTGLLVVLVTVLVVNQVVKMRQIRDRSRAVAAQAAIIVSQAARSAKAVSAVLDGSGDRDAASDEVRTYMMMLLVSAPVLIDASTARTFLEESQLLGGELAHALTTLPKGAEAVSRSSARLGQAVTRVRTASKPLLAPLSLAELTAASADEPG